MPSLVVTQGPAPTHRARTAALIVHQSGYEFNPDHLHRPRRHARRRRASRIYETPLAILSTHSYATEGGTVRGGEPVIAEHMTMTCRDRASGRSVDDMVDSGHTLAAVSVSAAGALADDQGVRRPRCCGGSSARR
jgi:hypothetical protein